MRTIRRTFHGIRYIITMERIDRTSPKLGWWVCVLRCSDHRYLDLMPQRKLTRQEAINEAVSICEYNALTEASWSNWTPRRTEKP